MPNATRRPPRETDEAEDQLARDPIDELTERGAGGETLGEEEVDQLTQFFLGGRRQRPGSTTTKTIGVNLSTTGEEELWTCTLHSITWEQWQEAQRLGADRVRGEDRPNQFKQASYAVAFGLVEPDLGKVRMRLPEDERPKDVSVMLREFFRDQPGALIDLQGEVLKLSRLSITETAIREVDAAKN